MLRTTIPLYQDVYSFNNKTYIVFRWCNLSCKKCSKTFCKTRIVYKKFENIIESIIWFWNKTIVFTWWEPSLYEPLILEIQEGLDKHTWYKYFFKWNREIVTNWSRELQNYYDKVIVKVKLHWWKHYKIKALDKKYKYIFSIENVHDLIIFEKILDEYNLKDVILQPKNKKIDLKLYCKNNWIKYQKFTNYC